VPITAPAPQTRFHNHPGMIIVLHGSLSDVGCDSGDVAAGLVRWDRTSILGHHQFRRICRLQEHIRIWAEF